MQVIQTLRDLADSGKTVIVVIHQPNQHSFALFDDLLLLSEGKQMYYGETHHVRSYMEECGYIAEKEVGTAEHILECISLETDMDGGHSQESVQRVATLAQRARTVPIDLGVGVDKKECEVQTFHDSLRKGPKASLLKQFRLLLNRSIREAFRGKGAILLKVVQQVTIGLVYGGIYSLGNNQVRVLLIETRRVTL
jgi:ATP-binding cassette subfamily G (WHITE) protein 1